MSFLDCIQTAVTSGRLSASKGDEASAAYEAAIADGKAEGLSDSAAETAASHRALKEVTELTWAKRRERIAAMKAEHVMYERITSSREPTNALANHALNSTVTSLMEDVDRTHTTVANQIMSVANKVINALDYKLLGRYKPLENMENIVRHIYGETVEDAAKVLGEQVKATYEFMRKLLNLEGASIPENPNFRMSQTHDRLLVRDATKDVWVSDHLHDGVLDWDIMRYHDKPIAVADRAEVLGRVWDAIVTEGRDRGSIADAGNMSMASRLSRERFMYYKTADSWLEMNHKYGRGDVYSQMLNQVDATARNVALMRTFGPNPKYGAGFAERTLNFHSSELQKTLPPKKAEAARTATTRELTSFRDQYKLMARDVDTGSGDAAYRAMNTARSFVGTTLLGGLMVTKFSDAFYSMWFRQISHLPFVSTIPEYIHGMTNFKDMRQQMVADGIGLESTLRGMHDSMPYMLGLEGSKTVKALGNLNYIVTGTSRLHDVGRGVAGLTLSKALAKAKDLPFDKVPFVDLMRNLGITERDWNLVKDTPLSTPEFYNFGSGQFLRPIDMFSNAGTDEARAAANKFLMLQELAVRNSVPVTDVRSRAFVGGATSGNSLYGQFIRSTAQFMTFPTSIMFTQWKLAMSTPGILSKARRLGLLMGYTTAAGALITQIKEKLKGNNMMDMTSRKFWERAIVQGGGGAILGDFIYDNVIGQDGPFAATTPAVEEAHKVWAPISESYKKYVLGDDRAKPGAKAADLAWSLIPKPQPFRLAIERMLYDPLMEHVDPAGYRRKIELQNDREAKTGQGHWWGVGDQVP